jgi:protein-S-isoprenylcysteine O-methyltransferase Ste14
LPPTLVYLAGFALGYWLESMAPIAIDEAGPGLLQVVIGWMLVGLGLGIFVWGLVTFASKQTGIMLQHPALLVVREGPYRWSRNPQYIGFTATYFGAALLTNQAWPLLLLPLVLLTVFAGVIAREERYMRATFGQSYEEYCRNVRRWL